jgi:hypothetical protein
MLSISTIQASLESDRSKQNVLRLVAEMQTQGVVWQEYMDAVSTSESKIAWKMGWLLTHYVEQNKEEGNTWQNLIWPILKNTDSHSLQRDLWRAFTFISIEEDLEGEVYDLAVKTTTNAAIPIAPRAHAMLCAVQIALHYSELMEEMLLVLSSFPQEESAGLRNRAKNLSAKLRKKLKESR